MFKHLAIVFVIVAGAAQSREQGMCRYITPAYCSTQSNTENGGRANTVKEIARQIAVERVELKHDDFRLKTTSPGYHAANDEKDIDADMDPVELYTWSVRPGMPYDDGPPPTYVTISPATATVESGGRRQ